MDSTNFWTDHTLASENAAAEHYKLPIEEVFSKIEWFRIRWIFRVAFHLMVEVYSGKSPAIWQEHALTYRDFTGQLVEQDSETVRKLVRDMIVLMVDDIDPKISILRKGSQVAFVCERVVDKH